LTAVRNRHYTATTEYTQPAGKRNGGSINENGSVAKNQPFKRWRPERGLTMEKYEKEVVYWEKLLKEVGRK